MRTPTYSEWIALTGRMPRDVVMGNDRWPKTDLYKEGVMG